MTSSRLSGGVRGADSRRKPRALPRWLGLPKPVGWWMLPVVAGLAVGLIVYQVQRSRSSMADAATPNPAPIDGERAYRYLKQICAIGPRPAGSEANTKQRKLVAEHFKKLGATVREQPFTSFDPLSGARVRMANLIGSWSPERAERVVIGAHYDTRPFPDEETDPARKKAPFLGANDGASGVALLMEIAHHLNDSPTPWGVDLVLFDGEELVYDHAGEFFLGSKQFAKQYTASQRPGRSKAKPSGRTEIAPKYVAGFVLDMVGDRDLVIDQEPYSLKLAGGLVREVWSLARRIDAPAFRDNVGPEVLDDHLSLNNAGIPTIDLIDFDYPHWHKASDRPEQCSAASLKQVGRVVTAWLAQPKPKPRRR